MKLEEGIQRVQSLYSAGVQSRSSRLTSRHIYSALMTARSVLLSQQANKNQKATQWSYQTLPCVELISVPEHECPCVPPVGCKVLRTKYQLPMPINGLDTMLIQSVTSLDGSITFDNTRFDTHKYRTGNKFTSKNPAIYIKNRYGYITIKKLLAGLIIVGLFDDFLEATSFPSVCGSCAECECLDIMITEIPIDGKLIRPLIQLANEELIVIMRQMNEDKSNNATDDTKTTGNMIHQPNNEEQVG